MSMNNAPIVSTKARIWVPRKSRGKLKIWNFLLLFWGVNYNTFPWDLLKSLPPTLKRLYKWYFPLEVCIHTTIKSMPFKTVIKLMKCFIFKSDSCPNYGWNNTHLSFWFMDAWKIKGETNRLVKQEREKNIRDSVDEWVKFRWDFTLSSQSLNKYYRGKQTTWRER